MKTVGFRISSLEHTVNQFAPSIEEIWTRVKSRVEQPKVHRKGADEIADFD